MWFPHPYLQVCSRLHTTLFWPIDAIHIKLYIFQYSIQINYLPTISLNLSIWLRFSLTLKRGTFLTFTCKKNFTCTSIHMRYVFVFWNFSFKLSQLASARLPTVSLWVCAEMSTLFNKTAVCKPNNYASCRTGMLSLYSLIMELVKQVTLVMSCGKTRNYSAEICAKLVHLLCTSWRCWVRQPEWFCHLFLQKARLRKFNYCNVRWHCDPIAHHDLVWLRTHTKWPLKQRCSFTLYPIFQLLEQLRKWKRYYSSKSVWGTSRHHPFLCHVSTMNTLYLKLFA